MKAGRISFLTLIAGVFFANSAWAGFWENLGSFKITSPTRILQLPEADLTTTQESPVTQIGRFIKFEASFPQSFYYGGAVECRGTVSTADNQKFIANFTAYPVIRDEPWVPVNLLRQSAVCLSAQRAFLLGQNVSVTGMRQAPPSGTLEANVLPVYSVQRFFALPENGGTSTLGGAPPAANVCTQIGCQANGSVVSFSYDLGDYLLCSARLKVPSQNNAFAEAKIELINKELCRDAGCSPDSFKHMFGRFQACQMLEAAFEHNETVTVLGYGALNGNQIQAVNVTIDKSATEAPDNNPQP